MEFDYYAELGIAPSAPIEVIRAAYRALAQKYHPDHNHGSREAGQRTMRIRTAYETLSDPESRRVYDEQHGHRAAIDSHDVGGGPLPRSLIKAEAAGREFFLRFARGQVIANDTWTESTVTSRGGGGATIAGYGWSSAPRITTTHTPKQCIGVRAGSQNVFINQSGSPIPVVIGQSVELVYATSTEGKRGGLVAVVNRSSRQWHWVGSKIDAGELLCTAWERFVSFIAFVATAALVILGLWFSVVRGGGFWVGAFYVALGAPFIVGCCTPVWFHRASKIGDVMQREIEAGASAHYRHAHV